MSLSAMRHGAASLGQRGIEQVGADGGGRWYAEEQDEDRRH